MTFRILLLILCLVFPSTAYSQVSWPGGAEAAVSLTYDDGSWNSLYYGGYGLDYFGLRGTFYVVPTNIASNLNNVREAFHIGHEIGNHSLRHYCGPTLETLSLRSFRDQVQSGNRYLNANIGEDPLRTFSYPCSDLLTGTMETEYRKVLATAHPAARVNVTSMPDILAVNDPLDMDPYRIKAYSVRNYTTLAELQEFVESARQLNGWAVITFHTFNQEDIYSLPEPIHFRFVRYLSNAEYLWVAPVRDVKRYISDN